MIWTSEAGSAGKKQLEKEKLVSVHSNLSAKIGSTMEREEESTEKNRMELERRVLEKVGHVISSIDDAKHVDQVIIALYSLAVYLFPLHPNSLSGYYFSEMNFSSLECTFGVIEFFVLSPLNFR